MSTPDGDAGTIVAAFGRHYEVAMAGGGTRTGYPRGKRSHYACGDEVRLSSDGQLLGHDPRRSLLYRSDAIREKLLAANVTQLIVVVATEPTFSDELVSRVLIAAESQGLRAVIVLNKIDLAEKLGGARNALAPFTRLGYLIVELCANDALAPLKPILAGHTSILVGQSGMGKSTLTNILAPAAAAATREISSVLDSGKHTTTCTRLYRVETLEATLIDSPGLQEFGLAHLSREEIEAGFIEFRPYAGHCRYRNCRHQHEPGCAIKGAVANGTIHPRRLEHFAALVDQLNARTNY